MCKLRESPKIVSAAECGECKNCCVFKPESRKYAPEGIVLVQQSDGDYRCPSLDPESGCNLGGDKPFECTAWPFSVSRLGDRLVLTLEKSCAVAQRKALTDILAAAAEVADALRTFACGHPQRIRAYDGESVILKELMLC
jgi:hypothetical protein